MDLDEFIAQERKRLELFEAWYRAKMAEGEKDCNGEAVFPEIMQAGEWAEQVLFFDPDTMLVDERDGQVPLIDAEDM